MLLYDVNQSKWSDRYVPSPDIIRKRNLETPQGLVSQNLRKVVVTALKHNQKFSLNRSKLMSTVTHQKEAVAAAVAAPSERNTGSTSDETSDEPRLPRKRTHGGSRNRQKN